MPRYKADFIAPFDGTRAVVRTLTFEADDIQHAIDQAEASLPDGQDEVTSIDLYVGEDKVQTVGTGRDSFRT